MQLTVRRTTSLKTTASARRITAGVSGCVTRNAAGTLKLLVFFRVTSGINQIVWPSPNYARDCLLVRDAITRQ